MKKITVIGILMAMVFLSGCAGVQTYKDRWQGRIDPISIADQENFQKCHEECSQFAFKEIERARGEAITRALLGAAIGAATGAATGRIIGGQSYGKELAGKGAGLGAIAGTGAGLATTENNAREIYGNCMLNRGFKLLW